VAIDRWLVRQLLRFFVWRYGESSHKELYYLTYNAQVGQMHEILNRLGNRGQHSHIELGTQVKFPENVHLGSYVNIGENCYLMGQGGIQIGDYCLLANNTIITTASHVQGGLYHSQTSTSPVTLEENVWVGSAVIILPGVTIGANAIIGAGAVVTKDIPANKIALGVPAQPLYDVPLDPELRQQQIAELERSSKAG
jgi:maltose O-acetyltransferase